MLLQDSSDGVILAVRVIPRAKKAELAGTRDGALLVRLAAPPVDGAANEALVSFLASQLDVPRRNITLLSGATSRNKRVLLAGVTAAALRRALQL